MENCDMKHNDTVYLNETEQSFNYRGVRHRTYLRNPVYLEYV